MPPIPTDCLDILRDQQDALEAIVSEIDNARTDRAEFGQESRDAHASTAAAVARCEAAVAALNVQVVNARVESAGAVAAAQASVEALRAANALLRNLLYGAAVALFSLLVVLLYATLTLRGVNATEALRAAHAFATPGASDRGTTTETPAEVAP